MKYFSKIEEEMEEGCGSISPNLEKSPHQEILEEQGEIFSCGGVYLANCFEPPLKLSGVDFLHLNNHQKGVLVFKGGQLHRRTGAPIGVGANGFADKASPGEAIKRFFKESLN